MPSINSLPVQISVSRPTVNQDANFGITSTGSTMVYNNVPARIELSSDTIMDYYGKQNIVKTAQIYVTQQLTLLMGDVISDGTYTYAFEGQHDPSGSGRLFIIDAKLYP